MLTYNDITISSLNELYTIMYYAEEYQFYGKKEYINFFKFINDLAYDVENNIFSTNDNLKKIILNWKYKNLLYGTINFNTLVMYFDNNMYKNLLYFLYIRSLSKYELNPSPLTIKIIFDTDTITTENLNELKKIDDMGAYIESKKIFIKKPMFFINDIGDYFYNNGYEIIYDISSKEEILYGMDNIIINETINNRDDIEEIITTHISHNGCKIYLQNDDNLLASEILSKYNKQQYSVIYDILYHGQEIIVDKNSSFIKMNKSMNKYHIDNNIDNIISDMKLELITNKYISNDCINCQEKIICMLGMLKCKHNNT